MVPEEAYKHDARRPLVEAAVVKRDLGAGKRLIRTFASETSPMACTGYSQESHAVLVLFGHRGVRISGYRSLRGPHARQLQGVALKVLHLPIKPGLCGQRNERRALDCRRVGRPPTSVLAQGFAILFVVLEAAGWSCIQCVCLCVCVCV